MNACLNPLSVGGIVVVVSLAASACSSTGEPPPPQASSTDAPSFTGTPSEFVVLERSCFEAKGIATQDEPSGDPTGFVVDTSSMAFEDYERVRDACLGEIGEPAMAGLFEGEYRERYDARVEQWRCLVDAGLQSGEPISYETFVADHQRSGEIEFWDPIAGAPFDEVKPIQVCPRDSW